MNYDKTKYKVWDWIKYGLGWSLYMLVFMQIIFPLIKGHPITYRSMLIAIPVWLVGGLLFGYWMKGRINRKGKSIAPSNKRMKQPST